MSNEFHQMSKQGAFSLRGTYAQKKVMASYRKKKKKIRCSGGYKLLYTNMV